MRGHLRKIHERPKKAYRAGNTNVIRRDFLHEKGPFYNLATSWHYVTSNWLAEMQIQLFACDWSRQRTPSSKASIGAWGTLVTWISNLIYMGLKFSTNFLLTSNFTYEVFWPPPQFPLNVLYFVEHLFLILIIQQNIRLLYHWIKITES